MKNRSTEVIRYISEKSNQSFPIIGVGGINSHEEAIEKFSKKSIEKTKWGERVRDKRAMKLILLKQAKTMAGLRLRMAKIIQERPSQKNVHSQGWSSLSTMGCLK